jgi:dihydrofolate reductase
VVFSRTLTESPDTTVELHAGDPVERVRALKQDEGKGSWIVGGSTLAGALHPEIDRLIIKLGPPTIGSGIPLFGPGSAFAPRVRDLAGHTVLESGAAFLTHTPASAAR